ncbi:MAG: hypothetical protein FWK04_02370 [Nostoc sp. GBBB01]|nr:hypothetical protein [Nostoc sp. GBBB01]
MRVGRWGGGEVGRWGDGETCTEQSRSIADKGDKERSLSAGLGLTPKGLPQASELPSVRQEE